MLIEKVRQKSLGISCVLLKYPFQEREVDHRPRRRPPATILSIGRTTLWAPQRPVAPQPHPAHSPPTRAPRPARLSTPAWYSSCRRLARPWAWATFGVSPTSPTIPAAAPSSSPT